MIKEMDLVELIVRRAVLRSSDGKITRSEFVNEAAKVTRFSLFTPMEADILFHFASIDEPSGRLGLHDFAKVLDPSWRSPVYDTDETAMGALQKATTKKAAFLQQALESTFNFALGSLAGAFGAFMVYPIDLVKTRLQNQRGAQPGQRLYKNSIDCFQKVFRNEGLRGLYSGVLPQLVGVAPEKAIKLTVNDLVRGHFTDKQGKIYWGAEVLAGASAGGCQVVSTSATRSPLSLCSLLVSGLHQSPRDRQDSPAGAGRSCQDGRGHPQAIGHVDRAQPGSRGPL